MLKLIYSYLETLLSWACLTLLPIDSREAAISIPVLGSSIKKVMEAPYWGPKTPNHSLQELERRSQVCNTAWYSLLHENVQILASRAINGHYLVHQIMKKINMEKRCGYLMRLKIIRAINSLVGKKITAQCTLMHLD